jgi:hypothetical protein
MEHGDARDKLHHDVVTLSSPQNARLCWAHDVGDVVTTFTGMGFY